MTMPQLLHHILGAEPGPFALLYRPEISGPDLVEIFIGAVSTPARIADVPLSDRTKPSGRSTYESLVLIPHQQVAERGFVAIADDSPLLAMSIAEHCQIDMQTAMKYLPSTPISLSGGKFDIDDDTYASTVRAVLEDEIGTGQGSNFVIKRSFVTTISDYSATSAMSLFRRLLVRETGTYWTFLVHTGSRTFVGATPERHVTLNDGVATMNPISGTYRYPSSGPLLSNIMDFLTNGKETDELYMVLDEELKMMARVCSGGGKVVGPFLREMARLAHTEYLIEGRSDLDPREILRETLLAPTVTGSPLESACRVIARCEPRGRGYYGGIAALIGRGSDGVTQTLDSAILIRTADIRSSSSDTPGQVEVGVGATLVRHSDPTAEVAETRTKASGLLSALGAEVAGAHTGILQSHARVADTPTVRDALRKRNAKLSQFWLEDPDTRIRPRPELSGMRVLVVDAQDTFSSMLTHQLRAIGLIVNVIDFDMSCNLDSHDLVVLGPGPGDPRTDDHPRMARLTSMIDTVLRQRVPFMAVCLSHQLLCRYLGLEVRKRAIPNQGTQHEIDLFGSRERVGFYNSYVASGPAGNFQHKVAGEVEVSLDAVTGEIHALRGPLFRSVQFHPESVLTRDGERILTSMLAPLRTQETVTL